MESTVLPGNDNSELPTSSLEIMDRSDAILDEANACHSDNERDQDSANEKNSKWVQELVDTGTAAWVAAIRSKEGEDLFVLRHLNGPILT